MVKKRNLYGDSYDDISMCACLHVFCVHFEVEVEREGNIFSICLVLRQRVMVMGGRTHWGMELVTISIYDVVESGTRDKWVNALQVDPTPLLSR